MKKSLIALLNRHGIKNSAGKEWSDTDSDADINAAVEKLSPATPAQPAAASNESIEARMAKIETNRLNDLLENYVAENKITKAEIPIYLTALRTDETGTKAILDAKEAMPIGGAPAGILIEAGNRNEHPVLAGQPTSKLINLAEACGNDRKKVYDAMKTEWTGLVADAQKSDKVKNANTFSTSLTTNFLILGATTQASPKFASVRMFSRDTTVDPYKPLATGQMKYNTTAQDGSTTLTNASNFESGDSTVTNVAITVSQYTEAFHITNSDLNSGIRMEDLVVAKMGSLGTKISNVLAANITAANFNTLSPIIRSTGSFGFGDMATAWGLLQKANRKNIMLNGTYLSNIINTPVFLQTVPVVPGAGWKDVIGWDYVALHTAWTSAGANILGFACDPQAIGVIAGLPLIDSPAIPGGILAQGQGMLVGVDLAIAVYAWFNTSTRTYWASYDLMFGANALDTTVGLVIATGTPT
jgi:hypothetical protein